MVSLNSNATSETRVKWTSELPPGPPLLAPFQTLAWAMAPQTFMEQCHKRYGDIFTLHFAGFAPEVLISDPDAIKQIFTGDSEVYQAGKANAPFLGPLMGTSSLLLLDGARHLRERKLMLPPFHGERMQAYGEVMREVSRKEMAEWPVGVPFELHGKMLRITFDVILRTVFGLESGAEMKKLGDALVQLIEVGANPLWLLPAFQIDLGPLTPWGRLVKLKAEIDRLLLAEIARRRSLDLTGKSDILSMMISARYEDGSAMTDLELRDEMITLLVAGHETTATALAWTLYHLLSTPSALQRCREEITASQAGGRREYLEACIKEALRLTPVIPAIGRIVQEPVKIGRWNIPAGVELVPCIYLAHRRPDIWPEPAKFKPERFLDARTNPYVFLPFGGGVRRCIGMAFAMFEMNVVLSEMLSALELRLAPGYRAAVEHRSITFTPKGGVRVILDRRA